MERIKEPFIHITKREPMPLWKSLCIRFGAVLIALIICAIFISASAPNSKGFFGYFGSLFSGAFGTERRFWLLLQQTGLWHPFEFCFWRGSLQSGLRNLLPGLYALLIRSFDK